jgi:hypothetical protein
MLKPSGDDLSKAVTIALDEYPYRPIKKGQVR